MFTTEKKEFKVGDVIVVKNWVTTYRLTVTRVTKLHAVCDVKRKDGSGYTAKFKKTYEESNNGKFFLTPVPRVDWNTDEYTVIPKSEE